MISRDFLNMTDEKLKFLLKNKDTLISVPKILNNKVIGEIKKTKVIDSEEKKSFALFYPRYALTFLLLFVLLFFSLLFYYFFDSSKKLTIKSFQIIGDVTLLRGKNDIILNKEQIIKEKDLIRVGNDSQIKLQLEQSINLEINNNSNFVFKKVKKFNKNYNIGFFLNKGEIFCNIKLPSADSNFLIETEKANFFTEGTKFKLKILEDNNIKLEVIEGIVRISNFIKSENKIDIIKKLSENLYNKIINFQSKNLFIEKDYTILLDSEELDNINIKFNEIIKSLYKKLEQNKKLTIYENSNYEKEFDNLNNLLEQKIFENKILKEELKNFYLKKINSLNIALSELNTSISSDNENIYITSDKTKSIYCIDSKKGKLLWEFSNSNIKKINSSVLSFNNKIFIPTTDKLYILNKMGKLDNAVRLGEGTVFWAFSIIANNFIYIPTLYSIYKYSNNNIEEIKEGFYLNGQIYLSGYDNYIYINALNDKQISMYNLKDNILTKFQNKLNDRSFNAPVYGDGFIYIADINKNLYKYNANFPDKMVEKISLRNTIVSNLIYQKNSLFFICDDGYFYEIETGDLNKINKIVHVENDPTIDKFLTKKLFYYNNKIYFSSNKGNVFCYDINSKDYNFIVYIYDKLPFIGTPVLSNGKIIVVDLKSNIYEIKD